MFDTTDDRIAVLKPPPRPEIVGPGPEALRDRCLHPAELWVMKRRAGRPPAPSSHLPAVARAG